MFLDVDGVDEKDAIEYIQQQVYSLYKKQKKIGKNGFFECKKLGFWSVINVFANTSSMFLYVDGIDNNTTIESIQQQAIGLPKNQKMLFSHKLNDCYCWQLFGHDRTILLSANNAKTLNVAVGDALLLQPSALSGSVYRVYRAYRAAGGCIGSQRSQWAEWHQNGRFWRVYCIVITNRKIIEKNFKKFKIF